MLVSGGAGYVGSHTAKALAAAGFEVLVFDDFSTGRRELVRGREVIIGDLRNPGEVRDVFRAYEVAAVLHFASRIRVGESFADPRKYYEHNLKTSLNLLGGMLDAGVKACIFSSSAAVYGIPQEIPITETHPLEPISPYGRTKLMIERVLADYGRAFGLRSLSLRYFNASGADPERELGELHEPETHLVPNILLSLLGRRPVLEVYGTDYPTPDGTAIRDYIHVTDLAEAHVLALKAVLDGRAGGAVNLGTNRGYSVLEVIRTAERVTGRQVPYLPKPRREGDPAVLLASRAKAERELGWKPRLSELETIIRTAWDWHRRPA
ncbi:MAG: UDP-glucose 4-epimerase GalE [Candidatus Aminicenantes bacterium]|nr:UDP-glucose 4-epimerase GalE [Candidatus Aminicenantes bacterium]